jgi:hypothetical protein
MAKDNIRLCFLDEVVNQKNVAFRVFLESDGDEKSFLNIRTNSNTYRFNNFNVIEDDFDNSIVFCPVVVGCYTYFIINNSEPVNIEVVRKGANEVDRKFVLGPGENKIELIPTGIKSYVMRLDENSTNSQLVQSNEELEKLIIDIQKKIDDIQAKNEQLTSDKAKLLERLEKLQAEYDKDYTAYEADVEEIKSKFQVDEEILKMYSGKDVYSIEELMARSEKDIKEIEQQLKIFIEAQQRKIDAIERE